MIDLIRSNSIPLFGFYGVEIFTEFEAGFESPRILTLALIRKPLDLQIKFGQIRTLSAGGNSEYSKPLGEW